MWSLREATPFLDELTNKISYGGRDPNSSARAVIGSVMDIDSDHLSAASYIQRRLGGKSLMPAGGLIWQVPINEL